MVRNFRGLYVEGARIAFTKSSGPAGQEGETQCIQPRIEGFTKTI